MTTHVKEFLDNVLHKIKHPRSPHWGKFRKSYLETHGSCVVCGGTKKLNVHHIKPFHLHPELELDDTNVITLCESNKHGVNCHLLFGHLGNFRHINEDVIEDVKIWKEKLHHGINHS